jgi:hypothetical protein
MAPAKTTDARIVSSFLFRFFIFETLLVPLMKLMPTALIRINAFSVFNRHGGRKKVTRSGVLSK